MEIVGLLIILAMVLVLPFLVKQVEHNLEIFLFIMGLSATIVSGEFSFELIKEIFSNPLMYAITGAVLVAGIVFSLLKSRIKLGIETLLKLMPLKVLIFLVVVVLGLASSVITAIIAALLLVEIVNAMPINRQNKINLTIVACFSIGLGAVLTPVGEPLSTIVISKLGKTKEFFYLFELVGEYVVPACILLGVFAAFIIGKAEKKGSKTEELVKEDEKETLKDVFIRAGKIFLFIFALELLGTGFKVMIDRYVIDLPSQLLYFINMISAILDNATLAAAEISIKMSEVQIKAILMGLLISGGMLIPGNIPNIISASKLKIKSKEWAKLGVPLGIIILIVYFVIIFLFNI